MSLSDCSYTCHRDCESQVQLDCNQRDRKQETPSPRSHCSSTTRQHKVRIKDCISGSKKWLFVLFPAFSLVLNSLYVGVCTRGVRESGLISKPTLLHNHTLSQQPVLPPQLSTYTFINAFIELFLLMDASQDRIPFRDMSCPLCSRSELVCHLFPAIEFPMSSLSNECKQIRFNHRSPLWLSRAAGCFHMFCILVE